MKRTLFGVLLIGLATVATAQGASATGTATATLLQGITIVNDTAWAFGSFTRTGSTAETLNMAADGSRTPIAGIQLVGGANGTPGTFTASGTSGATFSITLPASVTLSSGANTMTITSVTSDAGVNPTLTGGAKQFHLAGTLGIGASQAPGAYSGTYSVSIAYN